MRQAVRLAGTRHRRSRGGFAVLTVLCLLLRLAAAAAPSGVADPGSAAGFGEHALCLSEAARNAAGEIPPEPLPVAPGGHADHDAAKCCQAHAAVGALLPVAAAATRIAFAPGAAVFVAVETPSRPSNGGRVRARGPPLLAG